MSANYSSSLLEKARGFTLVELMITVVIIGILASIALPSYSRYVLRANRTTAKGFMQDLASRQQSFFSDRKVYATGLSGLGFAANTIGIGRDGTPLPSDDSKAIYNVSLRPDGTSCPTTVPSGTGGTFAYMIYAAPLNQQADDEDCAILCLSSTGYRGASAGGGNCWK